MAKDLYLRREKKEVGTMVDRNNSRPLFLQAVRCPVCGAGMAWNSSAGAGVLYCLGEKVHAFDAARSGYIHLVPGHAGSGDGKEAVRARHAFLTAGYYECAAQMLCDLTRSYAGEGLIVDAGCGEGYYSNFLAEREGREVCGFDLSRDGVATAARDAARRSLHATYGVASVFSLPLADASASAVLNIFAPCAESEYRRVLSEGGILIVVGAGKQHLMGLKKVLYDQTYENPGRQDLPCGLRLLEQTTVHRTICVEGEEQVANLFAMTPYYWRTSPHDAERLRGRRELETSVSFDFFVYGV